MLILDLYMSALLSILIIGILVAAIYRIRVFRLEGLPVWAGPMLFGVKLVFGFALWAVYTFYYTDRSTSDIYKFYDDAHYVHQAYGQDRVAFYGLMMGREDSSTDVYTSQMKNWERNFASSIPFNENRFMIRLNAAMMFISGENIHVHTVFFCFFSSLFFRGLYLITQSLSILPIKRQEEMGTSGRVVSFFSFLDFGRAQGGYYRPGAWVITIWLFAF